MADIQTITQRVDKKIIYITLALILISLFLGASTFAGINNNTSTFVHFVKHLVIAAFSFITMFVFMTIDFQVLRRYSKAIMIASTILFFLTIFVGVTLNSATRWIEIPFIGLTIQPSEFLRVAFIILVAGWMAEVRQDEPVFEKTIKKILIWTLVVMLPIAYSNISTAIILMTVIFILLICSSVKLKVLAKYIGLFIGLLVVLFVLASIFKLGRTATALSRIEDMGKVSSYSQKTQALIAISNAHIIPHPGSSRQKYLLPNAESDYTFAIAVEEYGIVGLVAIMLLFIMLLFRIGLIINSQKKAFPTYLAIGLASNILVQALIHFMVNVGIMPVTGQPLPLVSRGGSSMFVIAIQLGIILNISANKPDENGSSIIDNSDDNTTEPDDYDPLNNPANSTVLNHEPVFENSNKTVNDDNPLNSFFNDNSYKNKSTNSDTITENHQNYDYSSKNDNNFANLNSYENKTYGSENVNQNSLNLNDSQYNDSQINSFSRKTEESSYSANSDNIFNKNTFNQQNTYSNNSENIYNQQNKIEEEQKYSVNESENVFGSSFSNQNTVEKDSNYFENDQSNITNNQQDNTKENNENDNFPFLIG